MTTASYPYVRSRTGATTDGRCGDDPSPAAGHVGFGIGTAGQLSTRGSLFGLPLHAAANLDDLPHWTVLVATFARHDSGHSSDPLTLATQHFA